MHILGYMLQKETGPAVRLAEYFTIWMIVNNFSVTVQLELPVQIKIRVSKGFPGFGSDFCKKLLPSKKEALTRLSIVQQVVAVL